MKIRFRGHDRKAARRQHRTGLKPIKFRYFTVELETQILASSIPLNKTPVVDLVVTTKTDFLLAQLNLKEVTELRKHFQRQEKELLEIRDMIRSERRLSRDTSKPAKLQRRP
jgi:hypothetical protein